MSEYAPLQISRTFEAPRQAVWDAWTQPEQFKQWYMPAPFSVPACEFDLRPGGLLSISTQGPDGSIMPLTGEFKVVEEPSKLVLTNSPLDGEGKKLFEIQHTILFSEVAGGTVLDITSEVLSAGPNADQFLSGMKPGLEQAFDQLATLLAA
ncbi:MAG: SRPBCC domain-containing protein [Patescibacteria group bacterium]|nr:SRPBCC domain-containing protein [Patescibacteria group bacterium]